MLDHRPDPRQAPVAKPLRLGERTVLGAALVDSERDPTGLGLGLEFLGVTGYPTTSSTASIGGARRTSAPARGN